MELVVQSSRSTAWLQMASRGSSTWVASRSNRIRFAEIDIEEFEQRQRSGAKARFATTYCDSWIKSSRQRRCVWCLRKSAHCQLVRCSAALSQVLERRVARPFVPETADVLSSIHNNQTCIS